MSSSNIPSLQDSKATETSLQVIPLDHTFWLYQFPTTQPLPEILQKRIFQSSISNSDTKSSNDRNQEDKQSGKGFVTVTRNVEEWSIMIEMDEEEDNLRKELQPFLGSDSPEEDKEDGGKARKREGKEEGPWSCLKVRGPMVLTLKGIAADLTALLASAGVAIFLISTWNTDYIFVKKGAMQDAIKALKEGGWVVI